MNTYGLLDIDNFSEFNKLFGYERGNRLLIETEITLQESLKPLYAAKLNSDEFIFHLNGSFLENKNSLLFLLSNLNKKFDITASIGILEVRRNFDFDKIINHLMTNMLYAKINGKNKIYVG